MPPGDKAAAMRMGAQCGMCPAKDSSLVPPAQAHRKLRLIVVGEGATRGEEKLGRPFVGIQGGILDAGLKAAGVSRADVYLTNAALCRANTDKDAERAAVCCAPRLLAELATLPREVPIVAAGRPVMRTLFAFAKILVARGFLWRMRHVDPTVLRAADRKAAASSRQDEMVLRAATLRGRAPLEGRIVFPAIHPGFVARADTWGALFTVDMRRVGRFLAGELRGDDEVVPGVGGPQVLAGLGPVVSCDVETDGIDPTEANLLCVGVSDGVRTGVVWPWRRSYARPLARFLAARKSVVFHNGNNYDLIVLERHGVTW